MADLPFPPIGTSMIIYNLMFMATVDVLMFVLSLTFIAVGALESATEPNVVIVLIMSVMTLFSMTYWWYIQQQSHTIPLEDSSSPGHRLTQLLVRLPSLLAVGWVIPAGIGLLISARQPLCLTTVVRNELWRQGWACRLHRTIVALSVTMLIATWSMFWLCESRQQRIKIRTPMRDPEKSTPQPSDANTHLIITQTVHPADRPVVTMQMEDVESGYQHWLQRRDSLSSRKAIYPAACSASRRADCIPMRPFHGRLRSLSDMSNASLTGTLSTDTFSSHGDSLTSRLTSSPSWTYHSYSSIPSVSRSPGRCVRLALTKSPHAGKISTIVEVVPEGRSPSPPLPAWCPYPIRQAPLSSDPVIQELVTGVWLDTKRVMPRARYHDQTRWPLGKLSANVRYSATSPVSTMLGRKWCAEPGSQKTVRATLYGDRPMTTISGSSYPSTTC